VRTFFRHRHQIPTHDLTAARSHGIIDALTSANVMTFADKAYQGARGGVRTPFKRHRHRTCRSWRRPSTGQMPASAPAAYVPTPPSRPGKS
jgi:hypothetical protein